MAGQPRRPAATWETSIKIRKKGDWLCFVCKATVTLWDLTDVSNNLLSSSVVRRRWTCLRCVWWRCVIQVRGEHEGLAEQAPLAVPWQLPPFLHPSFHHCILQLPPASPAAASCFCPVDSTNPNARICHKMDYPKIFRISRNRWGLPAPPTPSKKSLPQQRREDQVFRKSSTCR